MTHALSSLKSLQCAPLFQDFIVQCTKKIQGLVCLSFFYRLKRQLFSPARMNEKSLRKHFKKSFCQLFQLVENLQLHFLSCLLISSARTNGSFSQKSILDWFGTSLFALVAFPPIFTVSSISVPKYLVWLEGGNCSLSFALFYATDFTTVALLPMYIYSILYVICKLYMISFQREGLFFRESLSFQYFQSYIMVAVNHGCVEKKCEKLSIWKIPFGV